MAGVMVSIGPTTNRRSRAPGPPAMIADFQARGVRGDNRRWRFQSHVLRPFIVGSDMPASIMIKPPAL
jgi:hypothetical protein